MHTRAEVSQRHPPFDHAVIAGGIGRNRVFEGLVYGCRARDRDTRAGLRSGQDGCAGNQEEAACGDEELTPCH
jgi:hypothetical protein